nr:MAG TPA: hypothetical protein [Caudoviricetes sp.]
MSCDIQKSTYLGHFKAIFYFLPIFLNTTLLVKC